MTDSDKYRNNEILKKAVASLHLRFKNAEIARATKESPGNITNFLKNKKSVSETFLQTFAEAFKIDLREFGYTNGLVKAETKNPPQESERADSKSHYEKLLTHYISLVDRLEKELDFERSKNNKI